MFWFIALLCYLITGCCLALLMLPFAMMAATDGPRVRPWYMLLPFVIGALWPVVIVFSAIMDALKKIKR